MYRSYDVNQFQHYKIPVECCGLWVLLILNGSSNDIDEVILNASSFTCLEIISEKGFFQYLCQMSYLRFYALSISCHKNLVAMFKIKKYSKLS